MTGRVWVLSSPWAVSSLEQDMGMPFLPTLSFSSFAAIPPPLPQPHLEGRPSERPELVFRTLQPALLVLPVTGGSLNAGLCLLSHLGSSLYYSPPNPNLGLTAVRDS